MLTTRMCTHLDAHRLQQAYFDEQIKAGLLHPKPPPPKVEHGGLIETLGLPDFVNTAQSDPVQAMNTSISKVGAEDQGASGLKVCSCMHCLALWGAMGQAFAVATCSFVPPRTRLIPA